jgi:hypothetical protein
MSLTAVFRSCKNSFGYRRTSSLGGSYAILVGSLAEAIRSYRPAFELGLEGGRPNYTLADIPVVWVSASRLAFFMSAFEGVAVMVNPSLCPLC